MPRGAFSETNSKLLSIYTLIIFPTRFQQQIKLVQIPVRQAKTSADDLSRYRQRLFIFIYGSIIVPIIPRFILVLIPILVIFPEVFGAIILIPEASGRIAPVTVIEVLSLIAA